jgi:hypothetical protein
MLKVEIIFRYLNFFSYLYKKEINMCWVGKVDDKKIATEDIKTRKIVDKFKGNYYGYYQEWFEYELGNEYSTKVTPRDGSKYGIVIEAGFHSYAWDIEMKQLCAGDIKVRSLRHLGGQTVYQNNGKYGGDHKIAVMECTIPKGTAYWENQVGEIVSEKLILEEEIYVEDDCNFC